ncbi:MAG: hypothetical protein Q8M98_10805 [Candidatus Cloacimonadaceae bacterium]|nr:hypothetical protein [Candidatus Cloacimonadaceae bacterium]MDP3115244.1 hypothetical protein [Candidatus Cloacimonadaceae bacterium]
MINAAKAESGVAQHADAAESMKMDENDTKLDMKIARTGQEIGNAKLFQPAFSH